MSDIEQKQENEIIREKMKNRPINKRKLLRQMIITAAMAVIFGLIACLTFLLLEPVFSNWLNPEEEPKVVEIPEDTEEMLPEDMLIEEETTTEEVTEPQTETIIQKVDLEIADYQLLYTKIEALVQEVSKSTVTVTGVNSSMDWFNNPVEAEGQAAGLIIADNGKELLILVEKSVLEQAEDIHVTFCDNTQATATLKESDSNTGLAVIAVDLTEISTETLDVVTAAELGTSQSASIMASPVIAVGRPYGINSSAAYGMVTSTDTVLNMTDCNNQLITTDIYGSKNATGVLFNLSGQVLGIINQSFNEEDMGNLVSAIGITDLKKTIARMSNGIGAAYLGVTGTDVTEEANESLGVPLGTYVTGIIMDSPAMSAGIQSGDVIIRMNETEIPSFEAFTDFIAESKEEDVVTVTLMRQGSEEYREMTLEVTLGKLD